MLKIMQNNSSTKKQALAFARQLFGEMSENEILHELDEIFLGYLDSEFANDQDARSFRVSTYFALKGYFKQMATLKLTSKKTTPC